MRGEKGEFFAGLVRNTPKTFPEFVTEASTIEKALEMRAKQYYCNFVGGANANYVDIIRIPAGRLCEFIRAVVREARRKLLPTLPQPQVASLTDLISEEAQQAFATSSF